MEMTQKPTKRHPTLRFPGFMDDWEERELGEISKTTIGEFVIKTKQSDKSPYPVYNGGISYTGKYDEYNNEGPKIVISARGANAGFVNYVSRRYWAGNSCYSVSVAKKDEFSIGYLYQYIKHNQMLFTAYQQAANIPSVSKSDVEKFSIKYPTFLEQKKLDSFFKQLDDTIALHQRKLDLLKEQKKAFLQKMFPKKGAKTPEVRFPGFTDDWEERKLGDEVTFFSGLTYSPDNIVESGSTLVLRSSNVKNGEIVDADNVYVENEAVNSDNVQVGDVIVVVRNGSRNLIGKHAQIKKEMDDTVIGAFMTGVRSDAPYFINALLDTERFTREIYKNLGATINQITTGAFKKMQFVVPKNKTEQEQIGNFFKQIDDTIALHQRRLDLLKEQKKAFLQKMFV